MPAKESGASEQLLVPWLQTLWAASDHRGTLVEVTKSGAPGQSWCRAFTLSTTAPSARGGHAHRKCTQALIAVVGTVVVRSQGAGGASEFHLSSATEALIVPPWNWLDLEMSENATLLVLADRPYEPEDYVRDLETFAIAALERPSEA